MFYRDIQLKSNHELWPIKSRALIKVEGKRWRSCVYVLVQLLPNSEHSPRITSNCGKHTMYMVKQDLEIVLEFLLGSPVVVEQS